MPYLNLPTLGGFVNVLSANGARETKKPSVLSMPEAALPYEDDTGR